MMCVFLFLATIAIVTRMTQAESECGGSIKRRVGHIALPEKIPDSIDNCNWTIPIPDGHVGMFSIDRYTNDSISDSTSLDDHQFRVYQVLHSGQKKLIKRMSGHQNNYFTFSNSSIAFEYRFFNTSSNDQLFYVFWMVEVVPSIRDCPSGKEVKDGYIKEGTTATCQCYHPSVDNFFGYPVWLDGTGNLVKHRTYEPTSLTLRYNPNDGPNVVTLVTHHDPKENFQNSTSTFTVDCEVLFNDTNPAPLISLEGTGVTSISLVQVYNTSHSYRHKFIVTVESPALIDLKCVASNSVFPDLSVTHTVSIPSGAYTTEEKNDLNTDLIMGVGISVGCCLILAVVMFIMGVKIGKRRKEASNDVIMLQPSPGDKESCSSLVEEDYVDLEINQRIQPHHLYSNDRPESPRHGIDLIRFSDGYVEVIEPLFDLLEQRTGEETLQSPDFQDIRPTVTSLTDVNLGSNGRGSENEYEIPVPFPSNKHTVDYLDIIDPPLNVNKENTGATIQLKPLDNNESSVSALVGSSGDVDCDLPQVYQTTEFVTANCNSDNHYTGFLEAEELIQNTNPYENIMLSHSLFDHNDKRVNLPQETNRGNDQSPKICQQEQTTQKVTDYDEPEPVQTVDDNAEYDIDYVEADDDYITVLPEPQASS